MISTMTSEKKTALKSRIAQVISEILTDKYGDEYGVKITGVFVPKEEAKEVKRNESVA